MIQAAESTAIDLSHEADFTIGEATVKPSLRAFVLNGAEETIEPRVMQVLVALARRPGEVVSRDDLVAMCWGGRVVGDDAISRAVALLRKVGETSTAFSIETVPRVGYRLMAMAAAINAASPAAGAAVGLAPGAKPGRPLIIVAAGLLAAAVIAVLLVFAPRGTAPSATTASVAVLPFTDQNTAEAHLATGLTAEMVLRLRSIAGLTVAGGDWMPGLVEQIPDPKALGERLAVDHLLGGSIRSEGDRLRVTAQLTTAANGHVVWSKSYDVAKGDLFNIQDQIAVTVANELSVALNVGQQSTAYGGTRNFEAYDHYWRGRLLRNRRPPQQAVQELERAVEIDPNYARAWNELAIAYGTVARDALTPAEMEPPLKRMDEASARAESLAPALWFGHTARGWYFVARNNWVQADASHRRAMELGEVADPDLYTTVTNFSGQVGRIALAKRMLEKTRALDPRFQDLHDGLMQLHLQSGQYQLAWAEYEAILVEDPSRRPGPPEYRAFWLALADGKTGRARELLKRPFRDEPNRADLSMMLNAPKLAVERMRKLADEPALGRQRYSNAALVAGQLGDHDLAVKLLRKAYLGPGWAGYYPIWLPQLAETRKTKAFKEFVRDLGFVEMWRRSNDWGDYCRPLPNSDFECG